MNDQSDYGLYGDGRQVPDDVMNHVRRLAVSAVEDKGFPLEDVARILNVSRSAVYSWISRYRQSGVDALDGRNAPGAPPKITKDMESWMKEAILKGTPIDHGFETVLWTADILSRLLNINFGVDVTSCAVSTHLKNMGLSYQKPEYPARERDPDEVARFLNGKYPRIQRLANKIGADIGFEDESGIEMPDHSGKTWGLVGQTPEIPANWKRGRVNVLSLVINDGTMSYAIEDGRINQDVFICFLAQLIAEREKPLILIIDHAPFHKSKKVRDFVNDHRKQIRVFFLPKYAPEMNPDEQVWNEIKNNNIRKSDVRSKDDLVTKVCNSLRSLKMDAGRIISFFLLDNTRYASGAV